MKSKRDRATYDELGVYDLWLSSTLAHKKSGNQEGAWCSPRRKPVQQQGRGGGGCITMISSDKARKETRISQRQ